MKKVVVTALLTALAGNAMAEWTLLSEGARGNLYMNKGEIRRAKHTVAVWTLQDLKETMSLSDDIVYLSVVQLEEFDCRNARNRVLQATVYEDQMAEGKALFSSDQPTAWRHVQPGTIGRKTLDNACNKNKADRVRTNS